jgi:hypothetical protein
MCAQISRMFFRDFVIPQARTTKQAGTLPLWNEILGVPADSSGCTATIGFVASISNKKFSAESKECTTDFELFLNENLINGFSDVWLEFPTQLEFENNGEIYNSEIIGYFRLRVSCSFNRDIISTLQRGLRPCCHSYAGSIEMLLLPNTPLLLRVCSPRAEKKHEMDMSESWSGPIEDIPTDIPDCGFCSGRNSPASSTTSMTSSHGQIRRSSFHYLPFPPCGVDSAHALPPASWEKP